MPLHDLVSLGEADSAAFLFGGEVKLENFVLDLGGDASALVSDFGDYTVQPMNFITNNFHVTPRVGVDLLEFVLQQLQVKHDGIDGILDFVGDSASEPAAGGKAARHFDFIFDASHRLGVTHG